MHFGTKTISKGTKGCVDEVAITSDVIKVVFFLSLSAKAFPLALIVKTLVPLDMLSWFISPFGFPFDISEFIVHVCLFFD